MTIVRSAPDATAPHLSNQMIVFNENLITASVELKEMIQAMSVEVLTNIEHLRKLAQTSASSAEETSQATDQQLASMEEISNSADTLARLADDLRDEVEQFKL